MVKELYGITSIQPVWKKQSHDIDYLYVKFVISLFFSLLVAWFLLITWMSLINIRILDLAGKGPGLLITLNNGLITFPLGILVSLFYIFYLQQFTDYFADINLLDHLFEFHQHLVDNFVLINEREINQKIIFIYAYLLFQGVIGGIMATLVLIVPFFVISIFFSFILVYFVGFNSISLTLASILSWFVLIRLLIRSRLLEEENETTEKVKQNYDVRNRNLEIIASNEPPIVCPGCRSFVSSMKKICNVCGEDLSEVRETSGNS